MLGSKPVIALLIPLRADGRGLLYPQAEPVGLAFRSDARQYRGEHGEMDDLVMAMMLNVRMINYISTFEDAVYSVVNSGIVDNDDYDDEGDAPLPVGFL